MKRCRYGSTVSDDWDDLRVELEYIKFGGHWTGPSGKTYGEGLFHHFKEAIRLAWPEDDFHRWTELQLRTILENRLVVFMGSRDSSKTDTASKWSLIDYWSSPEDTLFLMTSTTIQGLEMRVWGKIKSLFESAKERHPWLAGNVVDAKHGLFTDNISEDAEVRVMNRGIIGIPMLSSQSEYQGMALKNFAGIKQKRRRLVGDELQFIPAEYLKVLDAMDKGDFKAAFLGNPIANNGKALDKVSEPKGGWGSEGEITKTATWQNKYNGITVNLVGIDSPNFDKETENKFWYLVGQEDVDSVSSRPGGKDSVEWWSLIMGVRKAGVIMDRVLTVEMVQNNGGFTKTIWASPPTMRVLGVDAGFGGDPCVCTDIECGEDVKGTPIMQFGEQVEVPIKVSATKTSEDQIAEFLRDLCQKKSIPYSHVFVECGMRATLAVSMGRIMSPTINAINFGGPATDEPVSDDLFVDDPKTGQRRLKTCYEHYSKYVTQLAFRVRQFVEAGQCRNFPRRAAEEFERRETRFVYNDRHELETKSEYKERNAGESPNESDSVMIVVEGARRLGFQLKHEGQADGSGDDTRWLEKEMRAHWALQKKHRLSYT